MPIDRAATLRNAEKLLRQGKPDAAIAEYLRVVEEQPRDWNTANILGDLYVRAGQIDKAVDQFVRIADSSEPRWIPSEGDRALQEDPEAQAGRRARAAAGWRDRRESGPAGRRPHVPERRSASDVVRRGDDRGVAQIRIRLASLDPADYAARFDAARARI